MIIDDQEEETPDLKVVSLAILFVMSEKRKRHKKRSRTERESRLESLARHIRYDETELFRISEYSYRSRIHRLINEISTFIDREIVMRRNEGVFLKVTLFIEAPHLLQHYLSPSFLRCLNDQAIVHPLEELEIEAARDEHEANLGIPLSPHDPEYWDTEEKSGEIPDDTLK